MEGESCSFEVMQAKTGDKELGHVVPIKPARLLAMAAERLHADLLVLTTHGKTGPDAFWAGSVAPEVLRRSRIPLLLLPAKSVARHLKI